MIEFFVPGIPQPGGSKKGFYIPKVKRVVITDDNKKAAPWKSDVKAFAFNNYQGQPIPKGTPVFCEMQFVMPRPKAHYYWTKKRYGQLREDAPHYHTIKPDSTKLFRSTEDALTGIVWDDDAQVVDQHAYKIYGERPGARITVFPLEDVSTKEK